MESERRGEREMREEREHILFFILIDREFNLRGNRRASLLLRYLHLMLPLLLFLFLFHFCLCCCFFRLDFTPCAQST